jgi:hypothetical protein
LDQTETHTRARKQITQDRDNKEKKNKQQATNVSQGNYATHKLEEEKTKQGFGGGRL